MNLHLPRKSKQDMEDLPSYILMEIISRLPIKTVMAVRCVSKSLLSLVSDASFKELYSTRAPTELLLGNWHEPSSSLILYSPEPLFLDDDDDDSSTVDDFKFRIVFELYKLYVRPNNTKTHLVGSCNGLLCYRGYPNAVAAICNPFTGECVTFPAPDRNDKTIECESASYGFGFSPKCNRFKLLRIVPRKKVDDGSLTGELYTFGENGLWKGLADCPDERVCHWYSVYHEGILHWYSMKSCDIVTFDFDTEQFGRISLPHFEDPETKFTALGVFGDCLYINVDVGWTGDCIEVWVMKEYGVQRSWIKAFSIRNHDWSFGKWKGQCYKPVSYLQNKDILMLQNCCDIVCYNPDTSSTKLIGHTNGYEAVSIRPSLVSLKVFLGDNVTAHNAKLWGPREKFQGAKCLRWWKNTKKILAETRQKAKGKSVASSSSTFSTQNECLLDELRSLQQQIEQMQAEVEECCRRDREELARRDQEFDLLDAERERQILQLLTLLRRSKKINPRTDSN